MKKQKSLIVCIFIFALITAGCATNQNSTGTSDLNDAEIIKGPIKKTPASVIAKMEKVASKASKENTIIIQQSNIETIKATPVINPKNLCGKIYIELWKNEQLEASITRTYCNGKKILY